MGDQKQYVLRLKRELKLLLKEPIENIVALPKEINILEWHYVITGPKNSPYENGIYHGKIVFPSLYPHKPPSIYMLTPNGRFQINKRLCLSMSDYHPETWNPLWSVSSILQGLLSFMLEDTPTTGSIYLNEYERKKLASQSMEFNRRDKVFCKMFPQFLSESDKKTLKCDDEDDETELSNSVANQEQERKKLSDSTENTKDLTNSGSKIQNQDQQQVGTRIQTLAQQQQSFFSLNCSVLVFLGLLFFVMLINAYL